MLPDFQLAYSLRTGTEELFEKYKEHDFSAAEFEWELCGLRRTLAKRMDLLGAT